jgi:hypothetical protein
MQQRIQPDVGFAGIKMAHQAAGGRTAGEKSGGTEIA